MVWKACQEYRIIKLKGLAALMIEVAGPLYSRLRGYPRRGGCGDAVILVILPHPLSPFSSLYPPPQYPLYRNNLVHGRHLSGVED